MRTNLERAFNGRDMAESALDLEGDRMGLEDYESGLIDALANLMHFARRYEIDFGQALDSARNHHNVEARSGWEEVPDA